LEAKDLFTSRIFDFFKNARRGTAGSKRPFRLLEAALFQRRQAKRRQAAAARGLVVPPILIASLTRKCNLHCTGCYSQVLRPAGALRLEAEEELSDERFMEVFREAIDLGVGTILLAGGEPLMRRGLVERAAGLKGILLPLFTNGTLMDEGFIEKAARSSLVPVISVEGEAGETDARRGEGVYAGAELRMAEMKKRGLLFGASITLSSRNADLVLSKGFLDALGRSGISVLFIIEYVPIAPGTDELVLRAEQKAALEETARFAALPYPVIALPGDEEDYGGCLAAGRGFVHLSSEGKIEACPFAPFSDTDVARRSLEEALASPLMAAIRERHGELSETRGGCALWNRGGLAASLGASCPPLAPLSSKRTAKVRG
jgi:MoaA/NifB/PqqE/SkfB family radical SAM enzyme